MIHFLFHTLQRYLKGCFILQLSVKEKCFILKLCFSTLPFLFSDKWSPALQIRTVLLSIQALLSAPNPDDPLANDVAEQWKTNEAQAIETGGVSFIFHFTDLVYETLSSPDSLRNTQKCT